MRDRDGVEQYVVAGSSRWRLSEDPVAQRGEKAIRREEREDTEEKRLEELKRKTKDVKEDGGSRSGKRSRCR